MNTYYQCILYFLKAVAIFSISHIQKNYLIRQIERIINNLFNCNKLWFYGE